MTKAYSTYFIDLDGTMYKGTKRIPSAARFIRRLQAAGRRPIFVTNNSTRTPEFVANNLALNHDIHVPASDVYTSALATADYLSAHAGKHRRHVYAVGESGLKTALIDAGMTLIDSRPDYVVVGLDNGVNYHKLATAVLAIRAGSTFIGTNADTNLPNQFGMVPGAGSFVKLVEYATQTKPIMIGKPKPLILNLALRRYHLRRDEVLMIGDNYHTDIEAAIAAKMDSLITYTGLSKPSEVAAEEVPPTYQVANLDHWQVK